MRVLFAGSPDVAIPTLDALQNSRHEIVGVITQPAKPIGRKRVLSPTAVGERAEELGLRLFTPEDGTELLEAVEEVSPDVAVVVAYGKILTPALLRSVPEGWWNTHFSLLPRWRGAAPVQHALLAGDETTGVTLFRIVDEVDAGPIALSKQHRIAPHDTAASLLRTLGVLAAPLAVELLEKLSRGTLELVDQEGEITFAPKLAGSDAFLDFRESIAAVYRRFQAVTPEPGATCRRIDTGTEIKVRRAWPEISVAGIKPGHLEVLGTQVVVGTSDHALVLDRLQPAGKREMTGMEWYRGLPPGVVLAGD